MEVFISRGSMLPRTSHRQLPCDEKELKVLIIIFKKKTAWKTVASVFLWFCAPISITNPLTSYLSQSAKFSFLYVMFSGPGCETSVKDKDAPHTYSANNKFPFFVCSCGLIIFCYDSAAAAAGSMFGYTTLKMLPRCVLQHTEATSAFLATSLF